MTLSASEIDQLEEILFSEQLNDEALDYFGLHGLVCADVTGPITISEPELLTLVLGTDETTLISDESAKYILSCIQKIAQSIQSAIDEGSEIELPYQFESNDDENSHFDDCLESWCGGYMEGFFHTEQEWFTKGEDVAAELLLPIMALSGLFESDEFTQIRANAKLTAQFEEIIPEQLVDIYLFYHSD